MRNYLLHGRRHRPNGSDPIGGDYIAFDQPNTDSQGDSGYLAIDTGLIEIGDEIQADWVVTAIDYQWSSTGTSGMDFEVAGAIFNVSAFDSGGHAGKIVLSGESGVTIKAGNTQIQLLNGGIVKFPTNLPISDPGVSGQLWNDSGTLKISP